MDSRAVVLVARIAIPDAVVERLMQPCMTDSAEVTLMLSPWEAIIRVCDYQHECYDVMRDGDWDDEQEKNRYRAALTTQKFITWVLKAITDVGPRLLGPQLCRDVHICGCAIIDRICYHEDTVGMWVQYGAPLVVGEVMKLRSIGTTPLPPGHRSSGPAGIWQPAAGKRGVYSHGASRLAASWATHAQ